MAFATGRDDDRISDRAGSGPRFTRKTSIGSLTGVIGGVTVVAPGARSRSGSEPGGVAPDAILAAPSCVGACAETISEGESEPAMNGSSALATSMARG